MQRFATLSGVVAPLRHSNVDTDQIIPAEFLKRITKYGFEDALFYGWRQQESFVLNQPEYAQAKILVAGEDFGTGSSREHAVWALRDWGFRAVFSSRFGDIFRGNAGKQGLLAALLEPEAVEKIWELVAAAPGRSGTVELGRQVLTVGGREFPFQIDPHTKRRLEEGLDDISLTLADEDAITSFEETRPGWLPRTLPHPER